MAKKIWDEKWKTLREIGSGGQGLTYLVERTGNESEKFALKTLKSQRSSERRARMFREVAALASMSHKSIPKYVDGNTSDFRDESQNLYFVMDYI
jgi:eukaryotic-like serine/threonine-protein kinase